MPNGSQFNSIDPSYGGPWVTDMLAALGAPASDSNRAALRAWAASEGTLNSNNPLAISTVYPGATTCLAQCGGSNPVMAYKDAQTGANNNAQFLLSNSSYRSIVAAFQNDSGINAIWSAINGSPWCSGCQSGKYPTSLYSVTQGAIPNSSPGAGVGGSGGGGAGSTNNLAPNYDPSKAAFTLPILGTVLTVGQELKVKGWALMIGGGIIAIVGLGMLVATLGLESKAAQAIGGAVPGPAKGAVAAARRSRSSGTAGRRESREIERRYEETERQQGPIGPRGGNAESSRIARSRRQPRPGESRERLMRPTGPRGRTPATPANDDF